MFLFLFACAKPCELESLQLASNSADVHNACRLPEDREMNWDCETPLPSEPTYDDLISLHEGCDLSVLGSSEAFALAEGDPVEAAWVYRWMKQKEIESPEKYAQMILGSAPYADQVPFVRVENLILEPLVGDVQFWSSEIDVEGTWGDFPYWHVSLPFEGLTLALEPELSIQTLRHILASLSTTESPLELVVLGQELGKISLYPPLNPELPVWAPGDETPEKGEGVRINLSNTATVAELISAMDTLNVPHVELAISHAPCFTSPDGMRCVEGEGEQPTFYVDEKTVGSEALNACRSERLCRGTRGSWTEAAQLCTYLGKRLPSHVEIEAAELGDTALWTRDWDEEAFEKGKRCGDSFPCWYGTKKLLYDGRSVNVSRAYKGGVYCVSDRHILNSDTPFMIAAPLAEPEKPSEDTALRTIAEGVVNDSIDDKGICGEDVRQHWREQVRRGGRSTTKCRDPKSYVTSNEPFRQLWHPYIKNLGGAYVGVGSDQSYDFISSQRAEWAWVYDYDPNVYRLHRMMSALIQSAETPEALVALFAKGEADTVKELLIKNFEEEEGLVLFAFYQGYRHRLYPHYSRSLKSTVEQPEFGWLSNPDNYAHIRLLFQQGRIIPVAADMLGNQAMQSIGTQAHAMGVTVRVFYVSNAPLAWGGQITEGYRQNVNVMPFDDQSIFLATYGGGGFGQKGYWHYYTASAMLMRDRIMSQDRNETMIWDRLPGNSTELTVAGLPGRLPKSDVVGE